MKQILIDGKTHTIEEKNGDHFIDGVQIDEFLDKLPPDTISRLAKVGQRRMVNDAVGIVADKGEYQE